MRSFPFSGNSTVIADSLLFFISVSPSLEEEELLLISVSSSLEEEEAIICLSCSASSDFTELFEGSFRSKQVAVEMSISSRFVLKGVIDSECDGVVQKSWLIWCIK